MEQKVVSELPLTWVSLSTEETKVMKTETSCRTGKALGGRVTYT